MDRPIWSHIITCNLQLYSKGTYVRALRKGRQLGQNHWRYWLFRYSWYHDTVRVLFATNLSIEFHAIELLLLDTKVQVDHAFESTVTNEGRIFFTKKEKKRGWSS